MKNPFRNPHYFSLGLSVLLHIMIFIFISITPQQIPEEEEETEEMTAIFSLDNRQKSRPSSTAPGTAPQIEYERAFELLDIDSTPAALPGENEYYPFYLVDELPVPRVPYDTVINFPEEAKEAGISEAAVVFELLIDEKGFVTSVQALTYSGYGFEEAVRNVIGSLKFVPAVRNGSPVGVIFRERLIFNR